MITIYFLYLIIYKKLKSPLHHNIKYLHDHVTLSFSFLIFDINNFFMIFFNLYNFYFISLNERMDFSILN